MGLCALPAQEERLSLRNVTSTTFLKRPFTLEIIYFQFVTSCVLASSLALRRGARSAPEGC